MTTISAFIFHFIQQGLCINSSIDNTQFKICESITNCSTTSLNNTQYINYTTTLSSIVIMRAKLSLPENKFLTLSFVIQYSNGQEMESGLFTISKSILDLSLHNVIIIFSLINQIHMIYKIFQSLILTEERCVYY